MAFRSHPLWVSLIWGLAAGAAQASDSGLVVSQVYGGGGSSSGTYRYDYIELLNAGPLPIALTGRSLQYASATGTGNFGASAAAIVQLPATTLQPGQYFLVSVGSTASAGLANLPISADLEVTAPLLGSSGGKVALVEGTSSLGCNGGSTPCTPTQTARIIDLIGYAANYHEGSAAAPGLTAQTAAFRRVQGCQDTNDNAADFTAEPPVPRNSTSAFAACAGGGGGTPGGGGTTTVTPISVIQGEGTISPLAGQIVTTEGVVTRVNNNGFFIQSRSPDTNSRTSEGLFIFTTPAPTLAAGDEVRVRGTVTEFNVGAASNALTAANPVTELTSVSSVTVLSREQVIEPTDIAFPEAHDGDLEAVEGMLVRIPGTLTASQNYFLGRYGQITLSAGGRLFKPTNLHPAGSTAALELARDNARRRIILDDGSSRQNVNPTPFLGADNTQRAGDTVTGLIGVIDYGLATASTTGLADYKIHPTQPVEFTRANARTTSPRWLAGTHRVASFNVLNYFNGDGLGGGFPTSRGATTATEFQRQRDKIIPAILGLQADVVGLMEIENDGDGPNSAIADLVRGLNTAAGGSVYAAVPAPSAPGAMGSDEIKVAMIYRPDRLTLVGQALTDTAAIHNRPPLAQTFRAANGETFSIVVNHFKSKSCDASSPTADADQGDGQGCFNDRRRQQAGALRSFVSDIQRAQGDSDVLIIGDLNAYGKEDPILELTAGGFVDALEGADTYSYVFDGEAGYLDHALVSLSLMPAVTGVAHWHVNADEPAVIDYNSEFKIGHPNCPPAVPTASCSPDHYAANPYRSSDHDPVLIGVNLVRSITGTTRSEVIRGTPGDDRITAGAGADEITTGEGRDVLVYTSMRDALDTITDFSPGQDTIDLSVVGQALRLHAGAGIDLLAAGYVQLVDTAAGAQIRLDIDGPQATHSARPLVTLRYRTAAQVGPASLILP